ncbi:hypothetical protein FC093_16870 [Ilyomonas limi]|uniref:Uncharacterized protein n=1 Tax=Ilyomonas limi TaxID=2575867 RepID=A0A4U3KZS8_9BACT|nr:hypothetical protein [Ilyomonas limi]TKK66706.1 hypothetical protein FC093_16870 [Ilyomonas limi]
MKKILIAATIVGAVAAGLIIYLREYYNSTNELEDAAEDVDDAANDALDTMNKNIRKVERKTDPVLN